MSNFLEELFKKVFRGSTKTPVNHRENIVFRDNEFKEALEWSESIEGNQMLDLIFKNYQLKKVNVEELPQVHVLDSKYARGFAITYDESFTKESFTKLFLTFAQRILQLGYHQVSADRKMVEDSEQVKVTERFYYKPEVQVYEEGELMTQLYGNVAVEKLTIDNNPTLIKVMATYYSDRQYEEPKPFEHFIDHIFAVRNNG